MRSRLKQDNIIEPNGGSGEIRTHEGLAPLPVFKTGAFNRSATLPGEHYPLFHINSPSENHKNRSHLFIIEI